VETLVPSKKSSVNAIAWKKLIPSDWDYLLFLLLHFALCW
jgi:hypothetical protein